MRNLSVAEQQLVEIAKALSHANADIIIMDEPTSAIGEEDVQKIFQAITRLAEKGKGINSISAEEQDRLQAVEETVKALKGHSKRDVLCCWRNGLWAVARCTKKLCAAKLPSLAKTLYDIVNIRHVLSLTRFLSQI